MAQGLQLALNGFYFFLKKGLFKCPVGALRWSTECQWMCSPEMKNPSDIQGAAAAPWPGEGTDGRGEQFHPGAVRIPLRRALRANVLRQKDPAGLSAGILLSDVSAHNLWGKRVHPKPCSAAEPDRSCLDLVCHNKCYFLELG